jgi:hypothetical protein
VDYAPWGFAPFHYGRWGYIGSRWGWYPGPRFGVSIYGPAFVGFLGGGFGFGFGVGVGVGWFPLGFGEAFHPWYHAGFGYAERINVRNTFIRNVNSVHTANNNNYRFAHDTHAVTATSRSGFTGGQAVNRSAAHINEASLRGAQVTNNAGVSPTKQSAFGAANTKGNVSRPPSSVENRSVMARTSPGAGASHIPVHTMNTNNLSAGHAGTSAGNTNARQNQLSQSRPSSVGGNNTRVWNAQGNSTDRGQAPKGFGSSHSPSNDSTLSARSNNRPPWAGAGNSSAAGGGRSYTPQQGNGGSNNRAYTQQPSRANSIPSAPNRSYTAPNRTYSAPSRSYGGGSTPHGGGSTPHGGGSAPHGGGSAPHGGGGGGGRPHH